MTAMDALVPAPARVTVVIPTRDRSAQLAQALASVRAIEGPDIEFDIVVSDNGSTDDTAAVAARFGARVVHAATIGPSAARNAGIRAASGEFVAFLDDDDVWLPGHIRPHIRLLREHPEFGGAVGQVVNTNDTLGDPGQPWPRDLPANGDLFAAFLQAYPQIGATIVRISALTERQMFNEALLGDEDWDWHLRFALRNKVGFIPHPCVLFRQPSIGPKADTEWARLRYHQAVFRSNLLAALKARRSPGIMVIAKTYLGQRGNYAWHFMKAAALDAEAGRTDRARRNILRAAWCSPFHAAWGALRDGEVRMALTAYVPSRWRRAGPAMGHTDG